MGRKTYVARPCAGRTDFFPMATARGYPKQLRRLRNAVRRQKRIDGGFAAALPPVAVPPEYLRPQGRGHRPVHLRGALKSIFKAALASACHTARHRGHQALLRANLSTAVPQAEQREEGPRGWIGVTRMPYLSHAASTALLGILKYPKVVDEEVELHVGAYARQVLDVEHAELTRLKDPSGVLGQGLESVMEPLGPGAVEEPPGAGGAAAGSGQARLLFGDLFGQYRKSFQTSLPEKKHLGFRALHGEGDEDHTRC